MEFDLDFIVFSIRLFFAPLALGNEKVKSSETPHAPHGFFFLPHSRQMT